MNRSALGSARASRAHFGALAEMLFYAPSFMFEKNEVRDDEGVIASTRGRVRSPDKNRRSC